VVSFMMPSNFTINKLPRPKDSDIQLRKASSSYRASVKYSGSWSEKNYLQYLGLLNEWVSKQKLKVIGKPIWARYDAPYVPWFFRRNEILIPIKQP
ncbi:MAG: heme-binding protein, partial [Porticoccus sp.]|nr:heme-binding protein [Porticoccus sp.]